MVFFTYPALVLFEQSNCINWITFLLYMVIDQNIPFLVADSCRVMLRNVNSISMNMIDDIIENEYNDTCFCFPDNLTVVLESFDFSR